MDWVEARRRQEGVDSDEVERAGDEVRHCLLIIDINKNADYSSDVGVSDKSQNSANRRSTERGDAAGNERRDHAIPEYMKDVLSSYRMCERSFLGLVTPSTLLTCTLFLFEMTASHLI